MAPREEVQKRIYPEFRIEESTAFWRIVGILVLLAGSGLAVESVFMAVRQQNVNTFRIGSVTIEPVGGLLTGLIAIYFGAWALGVDPRAWFSALLHRRAWRRQQVTAEAKVNESNAQRHEDDYGNVHHTYWVTIGFDSVDGPVALKAQVDKAQYNRLQRADTVTVRYAVDNPRVALLEGEWEDRPNGGGA